MLYHFSEQSDIRLFEPRTLQYRAGEPAMVWTIGEFHAPHYYFPRDCPRVCIWPCGDTTESDMERFLGHSATTRIMAIEAGWLERMRSARVYRYSFNESGFTVYEENAGYYTCSHSVAPVSVEPMGDLLSRISKSGIELRITPSLMPLRDAVLRSTVNFSMIRMKNAKP